MALLWDKNLLRILAPGDKSSETPEQLKIILSLSDFKGLLILSGKNLSALSDIGRLLLKCFWLSI